jgi:hypothetical protein
VKKVAYLLGAGATQSELDNTGWGGRSVLMSVIKKPIHEQMLKNPEYKKISDNLNIPIADTDVEQMISLLDDLAELKSGVYPILANEFRRFFFHTILENLIKENVMAKPRNSRILLLLHKKYREFIDKGEKLAGILTVNFDSLVDQAFEDVYGSVNYGVRSESKNVKLNDRVPELLKLHGSFNWSAYSSEVLFVDPRLECNYGQDSKCLPPSVYKKSFLDLFPYKEVWRNARNLLENCDILRVIGCSLRKEDWPLISLIFSSQVVRKFSIELVLPEDRVADIENDLPFLGKIKEFSFTTKDVFLEWVNMKYDEVSDRNEKVKKDQELERILGVD